MLFSDFHMCLQVYIHVPAHTYTHIYRDYVFIYSENVYKWPVTPQLKSKLWKYSSKPKKSGCPRGACFPSWLTLSDKMQTCTLSCLHSLTNLPLKLATLILTPALFLQIHCPAICLLLPPSRRTSTLPIFIPASLDPTPFLS